MPTARADSRQQPARAVADQQQQSPPRRLFEDFEEGIGGVAVHLLRAIDNDDPPPLLRRGQPEKTGDCACILDDDVAAQPAAPRIIGALDGEQIGVAAGCNAVEDAALRVDRKPALPCFAKHPGREVLGPREQEASEPKGERRLADAARPAEQQRVRQPPRLDEPEQLALGFRMAEERRVLPRREHAGSCASRRLYRHDRARTCRRAELVRRMGLKPVTQSCIQPRLPTFSSCTKPFNDIPRQAYRNPLLSECFLPCPSLDAELLHERMARGFLQLPGNPSGQPTSAHELRLHHRSGACVFSYLLISLKFALRKLITLMPDGVSVKHSTWRRSSR